MFSVKKVGIVVAGVLFATVSATVMADDASSGTQTTFVAYPEDMPCQSSLSSTSDVATCMVNFYDAQYQDFLASSSASNGDALGGVKLGASHSVGLSGKSLSSNQTQSQSQAQIASAPTVAAAPVVAPAPVAMIPTSQQNKQSSNSKTKSKSTSGWSFF